MRFFFTLILSKREREFCSTRDGKPAIVRLNSRQSLKSQITHEPGRVTECGSKAIPNPVRPGKMEASCLFHCLPSAVKPNDGAEPFKQFNPFKRFKFSPGSGNPGSRFFNSPLTTDDGKRDARF